MPNDGGESLLSEFFPEPEAAAAGAPTDAGDALFKEFFVDPPVPVRDDATSMQMAMEQAAEGHTLAEEQRPRENTDADRDWSAAGAALGDAPTPQTYTEAVAEASKRHGMTFRPNPESIDDIDKMSDRQTYLHMTRVGLIDKNGPLMGLTRQHVDKLRGAYRYNMNLMNADLTREEVPRITQRVVQRMGGLVQDQAMSRIQEIEQRIERNRVIDFTGKGEFAEAESLDFLQGELDIARQDFAQAQELISRSGEPKVHAWFLGAAHSAADQLAFTAPKDSLDADRAQIFREQLQIPYQQQLAGGWPQHVGGKGPLAERMGGLLARNLKLLGPDGKSKAFGMNRIIEKAWRGTLMEERLDMLGISPEHAAEMSPTGMLAHTHPNLVVELSGVLGDSQGRKFYADIGEIDAPDLREKVEEWKAENAPEVIGAFLDGGIGPLQEIRQEFDVSTREGVDELKEGLDKVLDGLGLYAMSLSEDAGTAIGKANEFYFSALQEKSGPAAEKLLAGSHSLIMSGVVGAGQREMNTAMEEGEKDALLAVGPERPLHDHSNQWLGDMSTLPKQITLEDGQRMGMTKEQMLRVFDPKGNPLRELSMLWADEMGARAIDKLGPLGFHPSTIRNEFAKLRTEAFSKELDKSFLAGTTQEDYDKSVQEVARIRREHGGGAIGAIASWKESAASVMKFFGKDIRDTTLMLMENPDDLAVLTAGGAAGGFVGNMALKGLKRTTVDQLAKAMTMQRAKLVLNRALRNSPDAVAQVRKTTSVMQARAVGSGQRHAALEAATDALDYISGAREAVLEATPDFKNMPMLKWLDGQTRKVARKTADIVRHIEPADVDQLWSTLGFDSMTQNWVKNGGVFSTLREVASETLGFGAGRSRVNGNALNTRSLFDEIANDPSIDMTQLPISPEAINSTNAGVLSKIFPEHRARIAQAEAQQAAGKWMSNFQKDVVARRTVGAENRANLEQFTVFARTVEANRLRRLQGMKAVDGADPARLERIASLREESLGRVSRLRAVRQELLDSGTPLDRTRLRESPLFDDYTPEQMMQFVGVRNGNDAVYQALRGQFESRASFWNRVADIGARFDDFTPTREAAASSLKKQIIQEFFEQPGLQKTIRLDTMEGGISPTRLRRNISERKALGRAFAKDNLDELKKRFDDPDDQALIDEMMEKYELEVELRETDPKALLLPGEYRTRKDLPDAWAQAERMAASERANRYQNRQGVTGEAEWGSHAEVSQRVHSGRLRDHIADSQAMGMNMRLMTRVHVEKYNNIQAFMQKLSPDEQKLFDVAAVLARDEGTSAPLAVLRKRYPEYFDEIAPETPDAAVQKLWNESENFRKTFWKEVADSGLIDKPTYDKLIGPYAPRNFSADELPRLYGTNGVDISRADSGIGGVSLGELSAQRHITKHKAQIYPKGGRPITHHFDSVEDAEKWIGDNYGFKEDGTFNSDAGAEIGQTAQGSKYAILHPLGDKAAQLGADLIPDGAGIFMQMRRTVEDVLQVRYFNAFDRKGVAFTPDEFSKVWGPQNPGLKKRYEKLPVDARLGNLSGKYVHKNVVRQMEDYTEIRNIQNVITDAVDERVNGRVITAGTLIDTVPTGVKNVTKWVKDAITYNMIARNPATVINNFLSDTFLFTRFAAGSDVNLTIRGLRSMKTAWTAIRDLRGGRKLLSDMSPNIQRALELGVIDESIFQSGALGHLRRTKDVQATFGRATGSELFLSPLKDKRMRKAMIREEKVNNMLKGDDLSDSVRARLEAEQQALQSLTESQMGVVAKGWARTVDVFDSLAGRYKGKLGDVESLSQHFYGDLGNMNRLRAYLHLTEQKGWTPEAASRQVDTFMQTYSQVGNSAAGRLVKKVGKNPLGSPVVSFPFELSRITLNMIRKRPAALASVMGTSMARNMMAIAASGVDPYQAMDQMGIGDNPLSTVTLMGKQFIPMPNSQFLVIGNPAFAMYDQMLNNFGAGNGLASAWDDHGDDTVLAGAMRTGTSFISNFAFTSPAVNFTLGAISKRDSMTGKVNRDGYELMGSNLRRFLQPAMHPMTPIYGSYSEKLNNAQNSFAHAYTGREHSVLNKAIEGLGFKVQGDISAFLEALPGSLGDAGQDIALRGTKAVAWMQLWKEVPDERLLGKKEGVGFEDYLAFVIASSSQLDPQAGNDMGGAMESAQTDMRRAARMLRSEDEGEQNRGRVLRDESIKRLEELRTTRAKVGFMAGRDATPREVRNIMARLIEMGDGYETALDSFSVLRRTGIVARMGSTTGVPEEMMDSLLSQFMLTRTSGLRGPANADELAQATGLVEKALEQRDITDTNRERFETMIALLQSWEAKAEARETIEELTIDKYERVLRFRDQ